MNLEDDYDKRGGGGSSTETAYTVEARVNYPRPASIAGQIFDLRWRRVLFQKTAPDIGVPDAPSHKTLTLEHGMLSYEAAQALRWWFHAAAGHDLGMVCLETRLVSHKIVSTYEINAVEVHDPVRWGDK